MEEKMQKLRKSIKADSIFIYLVSVIMVVTAVAAVWDVVKYSSKKADVFEVRLIQEEGPAKEYCLFIDGENYSYVDYNEYARVDANGNENPKMCFIIDKISLAVSYMMMALLFGIACNMFKEILKGGTLFTLRNVNRIRAMAVITMLTALFPGVIRLMVTFFIFTSATGYIRNTDFLILLLGVLLGIISEIFKYGCELQADMDQIA